MAYVFLPANATSRTRQIPALASHFVTVKNKLPVIRDLPGRRKMTFAYLFRSRDGNFFVGWCDFLVNIDFEHIDKAPQDERNKEHPPDKDDDNKYDPLRPTTS